MRGRRSSFDRACPIFDDDALGDAGGFVDLFGQRLALDQVLELHDAALLGDDRQRERIPLGKPVALLDDVTVVVRQVRAIGDAVYRPLAAVHVDDREFAVAAIAMCRPRRR